MDITKVVARIRLNYYLNMLDLNNVLNQLKIRNNKKAERVAKKIFYECMDCYSRLGKKVPSDFLKES